MLCNITQNAMGQTPRGGTHIPSCFARLPRIPWGRHLGGVPCQVKPWGYPAGVPCQEGYPARWGGTLPVGGTLPSRYPARGYPKWIPPWQDWGYPARGYPTWVPPQQGTPPGQVRTGGYPVSTTEGVLTTRRAVCLLRSRSRTSLL